MRTWAKSLSESEKRIVSGVEKNFILCVLLKEDLLHFLLQLSFCTARLNPARDLGPRIMHSILPISNKGDGDWSYAGIPVVGPILGAALAVLVFSLF